MKRLVLAVLLAACGSDHKAMPDGGMLPDGPMPDAPPMATFTSYVIDLVQHQTADSTAARPYSEFESLPDPDGSNGSAYSPLFP